MRRPTLYKQYGTWYARLWDDKEKKYRSRALGIPVEGKKERKAEAVEAARKLAEAEAAAQARAETASGAKAARPLADTPLIEYVESFWQNDSDYVKEKTLLEKKPPAAHYLLSNRRVVELKMKPFPDFQNMAVGGLTKAAVRKWKIWLAEKGYSGDAINKSLKALRVPITRAYNDEIIPANPMIGIPRAAHTEKKRGVLTLEEIRRLALSPVICPRRRLAVILPVFCGLRIGEVRGLRWNSILDGVLHITKNYQEKEGDKPPKCGSEGFIPMPRIVAELLRDVYKIAPLTGPDDFVFSITPGRPASREYLCRALRDELSSVGIGEASRKERNIVYHSLRHTNITLSQTLGLTVIQSMKISRHKDLKVFLRYTHGEALDAKDLAAPFDNFMNYAPQAEKAALLPPEEGVIRAL